MRLLLLSNSSAPGRGYLEHAREEIADALGGARRLVFVPYALADRDGYTAQVAKALAPLGVEVAGAHAADDPAAAVAAAEAVFVGGGNSFRLLKSLYATGLVAALRERVASGALYIGSSAGTNMACPSLRTTNDMPIVQPPSFEALGLVPFQINPHYVDPVAGSTHQGETREQRLVQFLEENDVPVVGLREGTWLRREGARLTLGGIDAGARVFERGAEPREWGPGADLGELLGAQGRFDVG
ncbi:dipeptidase E [Mangrovactinospora gilvigrisea]|uniref:dipeptidase E n=1 Tax=Mangrovactinospora gilvigrisea TaxID=1428644 RepID=A0A1J7BWR4_9ACTN|nr:dipeptidase PepE [Mangrovactinospora gilvigrisea]OIV37905.1 dipeptidase E [Mangrovactinospora gilvigrisea]